MNLIYTESYILSKESYGYFTIDQNKLALEKNKRNLKITAMFQIFVGAIFLAAMWISKQGIGVIWNAMAVILIVVGVRGLKNTSHYDKKVWKSVETSYQASKYGENQFTVDFYEDRLIYRVGQQKGELLYSDFAQKYQQEHYFALHFYSGEVIIFNPDCNSKKMMDILDQYTLLQNQQNEKDANIVKTAEIEESL